jgi:hypothetical protein
MKQTKTTLRLESSSPENISARVTKGDKDEEELLTLEVKSLNIGREEVEGLSKQGAQASIVTVVALTWAT